LNHQLRGPESDGDAGYVSQLACEMALPATIGSQDVRAYQKAHRLSLEEAAREVRYAFFADIAHSLGTTTVAVGHTSDDQVETILMNLVRGTGLGGLRGMQPLSLRASHFGTELRIVRPLLMIRGEETESYCAAQGLSPRGDSSNLLPDQMRNRTRSQLVPLLREYNPDIDRALLRTARAADADLDYIENEVLRLWGTVANERSEGITIERAAFSRLHPALQRHLVRSAFQRLLGDLQDIESVHIENVIAALDKPVGKLLNLPHDLTFYGDYDHGLITAREASCPFPVLAGECRLNIPGETEFCGWRVTSSILNQRPTEEHDGDELRAYLDLDITGEEITVRGRRRGEKIQPLGMESPKKLQDFMVDAKIPQTWRDRVPLVCSPQHILWVAGWRIDHRARITPSTRRILCLQFEQRERDSLPNP
ncbi:MAG: tRNA lysidine(34) synthetase TilS, partial [Chloroflexota bacterium]|nr:tRNA lysidine(34) synthetase TilS [Chloroflexota bacterium]